VLSVDACHEIDDWLSSIGLQKYTDAIKDYGYDSFKTLYAASEEDIQHMTADAGVGIEKRPHRKLLFEEWCKWKHNRAAATAGHVEENSHSMEVTQKDESHVDTKNAAQEKDSHQEPPEAVASGAVMEDEESTNKEEAPHQGTMDANTCAQLLAAALDQGGKALHSGRLNLVGQGRGGKTSLLRGISNLPFEDTDSTIGVQQSLLEVNTVDFSTLNGGGWRVVDDGSRSIMTSKEAQARLAAQIFSEETPEDRLLRQNKGREANTVMRFCGFNVTFHNF